MAQYQVYLKRGISATLDVSPDGVVTQAVPVLVNSIGLRFDKVRDWALRKGGEVVRLNSLADPPSNHSLRDLGRMHTAAARHLTRMDRLAAPTAQEEQP